MKSFHHDAKEAIEKELDRLFPEKEGSPLVLSSRYSLLAPAKRFRPLLLIATSASYGTPLNASLLPACALEMIHTYSLIHDDLPCMDDDDLRRGRPSLHRAFPEWHALLTGDYLLTYAFEVLLQTPVSLKDKISLMQVVTREIGLQGMLGGQMIDLLSQDQKIPLSLLEEMHIKKTASLLIAALECGAILGQAPYEDRMTLGTLGRELGLAYQIIDDLLDVKEPTETLGKPALSDAKNKKATAISILGEKKTIDQIKSIKDSIDSLVHSLSCDSILLQAICEEIFIKVKKFI